MFKLFIATLTGLMVSQAAFACQGTALHIHGAEAALDCPPQSSFAAVQAKFPSLIDCAITPLQQQQGQSAASFKYVMQQMHHAMMIDYTGNTDTDFAAGMIPHHKGAVDMAMIELAYGKNPQMRALASAVVYSQQLEIGQMQRWLDTRGYAYSQPNWPSTEQFKQDMEHMHHAMMINYSNDTDIDFARGMIPHHKGAIDMAQVELKYGRDLELRQLAWDIIQAQQQEIHLMQQWLESHNS